LLNLASVEPDPAQADTWRKRAIGILESLWRNYSSAQSGEAGLLLHGTRSKPHNLMDHSLIYGDYYFLEALMRLAQPALTIS
jgi:unsaturated chondroitin disaccharide hydrolase